MIVRDTYIIVMHTGQLHLSLSSSVRVVCDNSNACGYCDHHTASTLLSEHAPGPVCSAWAGQRINRRRIGKCKMPTCRSNEAAHCILSMLYLAVGMNFTRRPMLRLLLNIKCQANAFVGDRMDNLLLFLSFSCLLTEWYGRVWTLRVIYVWGCANCELFTHSNS